MNNLVLNCKTQIKGLAGAKCLVAAFEYLDLMGQAGEGKEGDS